MKVIAEQSPKQFRGNWRNATAGQLWEETATHAQQMARISAAKYGALDRVFQGLIAMTVLTTIFLATLAIAAAT